MATLVLQAAGQAVGGFLGGPFGAVLGRAAGGIAGSIFDQALFGPGTRRIEGPRLKELQLLGSTEGAPIPKIYGRVRISGQVIWATRFEETATTRSQRSGGKGGIGRPKTRITEYAYHANFAVGLCQGTINSIGRVWADGKEIDISQFTWRLYDGSADQEPDSLIIAKQGSDHAPAYRGTAYIVFEHLPLEQFGNRLPQLSFEVFKALDDIEPRISAVNIIPGATEFGYDTQPVTRNDGWGGTVAENTHAANSISDWNASLDQLQSVCRSVSSASLVVAWFGDDLRCDQIKIQPRVETADKTTTPQQWGVSGLIRSTAQQVSQHQGASAFGSTPDDGSVIRAIRDLHQRGIKPVFYPFIMMDIPADNQLPDPYNPGQNQPAYPWRGRITCHPAIGQPNAPDKTAAVIAQVDNFFGAASAADFAINGDTVIYSGPQDWGLRRMVLHYAHLCAIAGGVDAFLIGSELKSLTILRDQANGFPAVAALQSLASDVRQILPDAKISYAADWSEYFGYQPGDGTGDVFFHLDDLWASPDVDFVAIDNYMPLSDWRAGVSHLDAQAGYDTLYDVQYLQDGIAGGEGFDWYYASSSDRDLQIRTPISDGSYNKPWVFRYKDLKSWWNNPHHDRLAGIELPAATPWVPRSKPVWFTEAGCPAIDKGTNQPNVFVDPKSVESNKPYFSNGQRDDFIQRKYIDALTGYWTDNQAGNPVSEIYGDVMVPPEKIFFWAWDARPFPAFPYRDDVWADGGNYELGHWLNGRLGAAPLSSLVAEILNDFDFHDHHTENIAGVVDGYVVERTMSPRQAIEPLSTSFFFDGFESDGVVKFKQRYTNPVATIAADDMVESKPGQEPYRLLRAQETDLPNRLQVLFLDGANNYRQATSQARKLTGYSQRDLVQEVAVVLSRDRAVTNAEISLQEIWAGRETADFTLPPDFAAIEVGDVLEVLLGDALPRLMRIEKISDGDGRAVSARLMARENYQPANRSTNNARIVSPPVFGAPFFTVLDLPLLHSNANPHANWIAARATPWPGSLALIESAGDGFAEIEALNFPAIVGETLTDLPAGPIARLDYANSLTVRLYDGEPASVSLIDMFAGQNVIAVGDAAHGWEVLQFQSAQLIDQDTYRLSTLLRGQVGSEPEMRPVLPAGSTCVVLDNTVVQIPTDLADIGRSRTLRIGPAHFDHANPAFTEFVNTPSGLGLRPLAPAHLQMRKTSAGFQMYWIRQTRTGGDSWSLQDVPIGEDQEAYTLDIRNGSTTVRTLTTTTTSVTYTNEQQQQDFGAALPSALSIRVAQISSVYGPGTYQEKTFNV